MRMFKVLFILVVTALIMMTSLQVQATPVAGSNTDIPTYGLPGPYAVGRSWFGLDQGTKQSLVIVVWYPALKSVGDQPVSTLSVPGEYQLPKLEASDKQLNWGPATLNAAADTSKAAYPLVIFSTGYGATPKFYASLEEQLASYGFVVMSALGMDRAIWSHYILRPAIITREIDFAERLTNQDGSFKGLIDTQHIGVVGHSSGGYTALVAGGAQFDLSWFETWCGDHKDSPDAKLACPDLLGHKQDMLALAKLATMPTGLWPSWGDTRVNAIVSQSGDGYVFGPAGLASVTIPAMVQVGSEDEANTPEWSAYLTYDNVSSTQKVEVVFEGAGHMIFAGLGGGWETDRAQYFINHFTTAFLLDTLNDDQEAHKALLPDAVNYDDIQYKTTMK